MYVWTRYLPEVDESWCHEMFHIHVGFVEYVIPMYIVGCCILYTVCVLVTCV